MDKKKYYHSLKYGGDMDYAQVKASVLSMGDPKYDFISYAFEQALDYLSKKNKYTFRSFVFVFVLVCILCIFLVRYFHASGQHDFVHYTPIGGFLLTYLLWQLISLTLQKSDSKNKIECILSRLIDTVLCIEADFGVPLLLELHRESIQHTKACSNIKKVLHIQLEHISEQAYFSLSMKAKRHLFFLLKRSTDFMWSRYTNYIETHRYVPLHDYDEMLAISILRLYARVKDPTYRTTISALAKLEFHPSKLIAIKIASQAKETLEAYNPYQTT